MRIVFSILGGVILVLVVLAGAYVFNNLYYDRNVQRNLERAGMQEKRVVLPDGALLSYGEGPDNGPALLLIHGQSDSWASYEPVLGQLTRDFHVFAVDCHGHGGSDKNPDKYSAAEMGEDFHWVAQNVIREPAIVSGHSSGGLLSVWLAANYPQDVLGLVIEDAPFFSTEPERCPKTFAWLDSFEPIHRFLKQDQETSYVRFYLDNTYLARFFGQGWDGIKKYANNYLDKHPGRDLRIFFLPPALNRAFDLVQGPYDLRFGDTFYDCSWFTGFDQAETLARVSCPSVLIHTNWSYDDDGVLLAAMDANDAQRAHELLGYNELVSVDSGHSVHTEKPDEFVKIVEAFKTRLGL